VATLGEWDAVERRCRYIVYRIAQLSLELRELVQPTEDEIEELAEMLDNPKVRAEILGHIFTPLLVYNMRLDKDEAREEKRLEGE
jgi:hypothetical protein